MNASDTGRTGRRRSAGGALSSRVLLALGASAGLTAAVALPMAYQAHEARSETDQPSSPRVEVLGTSTVPEAAGIALREGLYWVSADGSAERVPLHGSTLSGRVQLVVDLTEVERVDFRLNDDAVVTDEEPPFQLDDEPIDTAALGPGPHDLVATVRFDDGRNELRQATFGVEQE